MNTVTNVLQEDDDQEPKINWNSYKPQTLKSLQAGQIDPIQAFNKEYYIEELTGYDNKGITIEGNLMFSQSKDDPLNDGKVHDCFDAMMARQKLSFEDAIEFASTEVRIESKSKDSLYGEISIKEYNSGEYLDNIPVNNLMDKYMVSDEEIEELADPEWLYDNLIIKGHLIVMPAPPNGGKTTLLMWIAAQLAKTIDVTYVNADLSSGDSKEYHAMAKNAGFKLLLPDFKVGLSMAHVVKDLETMNQSGENFCNKFFIFDTLKKMTDVISKSQSKKLYITLRGLTAKGMTIVLLAHTNKYQFEGVNIYEGTGDLKSDFDEMIYLDSQKNSDGSMTISTRPDKIRGIFEPITFEMDVNRKVKQTDFQDISESIKWEKQHDKDADKISAIYDSMSKGKPYQTAIEKYCSDIHHIGKRTTKRVLDYFSKGENRLWEKKIVQPNNRSKYTRVSKVNLFLKK